MQTLWNVLWCVSMFFTWEMAKKKRDMHGNSDVVCLYPRTFLCVRLHSCGGVAIQGFDWILLSGLANALGCRPLPPSAGEAESPATRRRTFSFFFGCVTPDLTLPNLVRDWPKLLVQNGGQGVGGEVWAIPRKSTWHAVTLPSTLNLKHSCKKFNLSNRKCVGMFSKHPLGQRANTVLPWFLEVHAKHLVYHLIGV